MNAETWDPWAPPHRIVDVQERLARLGAVRRVPERVFLWGELPPRPWVSIVGTRKPSSVGESAAFELAQRLAAQGVAILSGGAVGVDAAAHRGALAAGGRTMVVAPTWWKSAYPAENRGLFGEVLARGGGYLTTSCSEQQPFNAAFFVRNEVMAALSDVMVLGDCPVRSGARNAMAHARRMGRPRYCLPVPFGSGVSLGNWAEAHDLGAISIVDEEPILKRLCGMELEHVSEQFSAVRRARDALGPTAPGSSGKKRKKRARQKEWQPRGTPSVALPQDLSSDGHAVALAVARGCATVDEVAAEVQFDVARIQHQIMLLTLQGIVAEDESGVLRYHPRDHE